MYFKCVWKEGKMAVSGGKETPENITMALQFGFSSGKWVSFERRLHSSWRNFLFQGKWCLKFCGDIIVFIRLIIQTSISTFVTSMNDFRLVGIIGISIDARSSEINYLINHSDWNPHLYFEVCVSTGRISSFPMVFLNSCYYLMKHLNR